MNRLTTNNPQNNLQTALNLFFVKDGQAWVRGGGEYPDFPDVTLYDYIRSAVKHCATSPELFDMIDDGLIGEVMADWSMDGNTSKEGLLGVLYQAGWAFAELRARLEDYEDTGLSPTDLKSQDQSLFMAAKKIKQHCDKHSFYRTGDCDGCVFAKSAECCPFDTGSVPADWEV